MNTEIERKFLIGNAEWRDGAAGVAMAQGYLSLDPERTVRVRLAGQSAWLTIKGRTAGISRAEFEYEIPAAHAQTLLKMCLPALIEKTRYRIYHHGYVWEVDVFQGENEGLIMAEVELSYESDSPELPPWELTEVSADPRYFNSYLASRPFKSWPSASKE